MKGYHYYAPYSKGYHTDAIKLPMRLQNQRSLKIAIEELKTSITERETFRGEFQALHKRGRKSQSSVCTLLP